MMYQTRARTATSAAILAVALAAGSAAFAAQPDFDLYPLHGVPDPSEQIAATAQTTAMAEAPDELVAAIPAEDPMPKVFSTEPRDHDGRKWRIAYYEGGPYRNYLATLKATVRGLVSLGWIEPMAMPETEGEESAPLWRWLAENARSEYLEFVADAHYSGNWDKKIREEQSGALMERLNETGDIDLLMAMGTWAGKDFANDKHSTATMIMSTSDPVAAGIIKSVEDSGFDHVHAKFDPGRFKRQLTVFHEITRFKKLGVAYEDTEAGRSYAGLDNIHMLSESRGFEVVECHTKSDVADTAEAEKSLVDCMEQLAKTADAIYVTQQGGITSKTLPQIVEIAIDHHVPTFSQTGSKEVKVGIMVSLSRAGRRYVGEANAKTITQIFNGAKPNELEQLFEEPPKIAINLKTAELVGFDPPVVLLGAADEIFNEVPTVQ